MASNIKKTFYFYTLHDCEKNNHKKVDFNYLDCIRKGLEKKDSLLISLANNLNDSLNEDRKKYELDNNIDVRDLRFTGEIKEIDEESYEFICKDDLRIMSRMSEKSKRLLTQFGFDLKGWHRPFKVEAKNKIYLKSVLKRKLGYEPIILFKDE